MFEDKVALNIESELTHIPFYLNHKMTKSMSTIYSHSPLLVGGKHVSDTLDAGQEIGKYITDVFMSRNTVRDYSIKDISIRMYFDNNEYQKIKVDESASSLIYFVNKSNSSIYYNYTKLIEEINHSTAVFMDQSQDISILVSGMQCVIVVSLEMNRG